MPEVFPPGGLDELSAAGRELWTQRVADSVRDAIVLLGVDPPTRFVLSEPDERTTHRTSVDWPGLPLRPIECVGRNDALALLDWIPTGRGRIKSLQEEYVEWRVVHDGQRICRVELTTELADYWRVLAATDPNRTLEVVATFARRDRVEPEDVYGRCDPFAPSTTAAEREDAFAAAMLADDDQSPYNDGRRAITCMTQETNTLRALVQLTLAATHPRVVKDPSSGRIRCLTCEELIPLLKNSAQLGRASDPVLVERLARLAYEGRLVALDDPVGVYIQSVALTRLRTPDSGLVTPEWLQFSRGSPADGVDGVPRWQRLTIEAPSNSGWCVSDLVDVATEEHIVHGGQIADLVQLAAVFKVSEAGVEDVGELKPSELADAVGDAARGCNGIAAELASYQQQSTT